MDQHQRNGRLQLARDVVVSKYLIGMRLMQSGPILYTAARLGTEREWNGNGADWIGAIVNGTGTHRVWSGVLSRSKFHCFDFNDWVGVRAAAIGVTAALIGIAAGRIVVETAQDNPPAATTL